MRREVVDIKELLADSTRKSIRNAAWHLCTHLDERLGTDLHKSEATVNRIAAAMREAGERAAGLRVRDVPPTPVKPDDRQVTLPL